MLNKYTIFDELCSSYSLLSFACYYIPYTPYISSSYSKLTITWSLTASSRGLIRHTIPHQYPIPLLHFILSLRPAANAITPHTRLNLKYYTTPPELPSSKIQNPKVKNTFLTIHPGGFCPFLNFVVHCTPCTPLFNIFGAGAKPIDGI